jgi:hypothetical protein
VQGVEVVELGKLIEKYFEELKRLASGYRWV